MKISKDLQTGKAGEYLVCFDLVTQGYVAFLSEQGLPFDIVLAANSRLYKVQVKSSFVPRVLSKRPIPVYAFQKTKGVNNSKYYTADDVDIFAFVGIDEKVVGYLWAKDVKSAMNFKSEKYRGKYKSEICNARHKDVRSDFKEGMSKTQIMKKYEISGTMINSALLNKSLSSGNYLSDLTISKLMYST